MNKYLLSSTAIIFPVSSLIAQPFESKSINTTEAELKLEFWYFSKKDNFAKSAKISTTFNIKELKFDNFWKENEEIFKDISYFLSEIKISYLHHLPNSKIFINGLESDVEYNNKKWEHKFNLNLNIEELKLKFESKIQDKTYLKEINVFEKQTGLSFENQKFMPPEVEFSWYAWNPEKNPEQKKYITPYLEDINGKIIYQDDGTPKPNPFYIPEIDPKTGIFSFWNCSEFSKDNSLSLFSNDLINSIVSNYKPGDSFWKEEEKQKWVKDKEKLLNLFKREYKQARFYKQFLLPKSASFNLPKSAKIEKQHGKQWRSIKDNFYTDTGKYRAFYEKSFANFYGIKVKNNDSNYDDYVKWAKTQKFFIEKQDNENFVHQDFYDWMNVKFKLTKDLLYKKSYTEINSLFLNYFTPNKAKINVNFSNEKFVERAKGEILSTLSYKLKTKKPEDIKPDDFDGVEIYSRLIGHNGNIEILNKLTKNEFLDQVSRIMHVSLIPDISSLKIKYDSGNFDFKGKFKIKCTYDFKTELDIFTSNDLDFSFSTINKVNEIEQLKSFFANINFEDVQPSGIYYLKDSPHSSRLNFPLYFKIDVISKTLNKDNTYDLFLKIENFDEKEQLHKNKIFKIKNIQNPKFTHPLFGDWDIRNSQDIVYYIYFKQHWKINNSFFKEDDRLKIERIIDSKSYINGDIWYKSKTLKSLTSIDLKPYIKTNYDLKDLLNFSSVFYTNNLYETNHPEKIFLKATWNFDPIKIQLDSENLKNKGVDVSQFLEFANYWNNFYSLNFEKIQNLSLVIDGKNISIKYDIFKLKTELENYSKLDINPELILKSFKKSIVSIKNLDKNEELNLQQFFQILKSINIYEINWQTMDSTNPLKQKLSFKYKIPNEYILKDNPLVELELELPLYTNPLSNVISNINLDNISSLEKIKEIIKVALNKVIYKSNVLLNSNYSSNSVELELGKEFDFLNQMSDQELEKLLLPEYREYIGFPFPKEKVKFLTSWLSLSSEYVLKNIKSEKYKDINKDIFVEVVKYWEEKPKEIRINNHSLKERKEIFDLSKLNIENIAFSIPNNFEEEQEFKNFDENIQNYINTLTIVGVSQFYKINWKDISIANKYIYYMLIKQINQKLSEESKRLNLREQLLLFEHLTFKKIVQSFLSPLNRIENGEIKKSSFDLHLISNPFKMEEFLNEKPFKLIISYSEKITKNLKPEEVEKIDLSLIDFGTLEIDNSNNNNVEKMEQIIKEKVNQHIGLCLNTDKDITEYFEIDYKKLTKKLFDVSTAKKFLKHNNKEELNFNLIVLKIKPKNNMIFKNEGQLSIKNIFPTNFNFQKEVEKILTKKKIINTSIIVSVVFLIILASTITTSILIYRKRSKKVKTA